MAFTQNTTKIDLGDTPIENIFLDVYMPMANGTYVKVYLLAYKYACDPKAGAEVTNITIAKNLDIPLSDVLSAWDFWESKGIIKKHSSPEDDENLYSVEFINLKQLYIDNNFKLINTREASAPSAATSISTKELVDAVQIPAIKEMFIDINKIIERPLVPNEKHQILDWFYQYNVDPPLIVKAFSYSKFQRNNKNVKYVGGILRNWYDSGITNIEQLLEHQLKQGDRYGAYDRIFKALGFDFRESSEAERKIMDKWMDEYSFELDLILKACESSSKTSNPNINYINSILSDWHAKGIKRPEEVAQMDQKPSRAPSTNGNAAANKVNRHKTKFHLPESRGEQYSAEELESLILNNQKKKFNR